MRRLRNSSASKVMIPSQAHGGLLAARLPEIGVAASGTGSIAGVGTSVGGAGLAVGGLTSGSGVLAGTLMAVGSAGSGVGAAPGKVSRAAVTMISVDAPSPPPLLAVMVVSRLQLPIIAPAVMLTLIERVWPTSSGAASLKLAGLLATHGAPVDSDTSLAAEPPVLLYTTTTFLLVPWAIETVAGATLPSMM